MSANVPVVLYAHDDGVERMRVQCLRTGEGLVVEQRTGGDLTRCVFGRSRRCRQMVVSQRGVAALLEHAGMGAPEQVVEMFRVRFADVDAFGRIQLLFDELGVGYSLAADVA